MLSRRVAENRYAGAEANRDQDLPPLAPLPLEEVSLHSPSLPLSLSPSPSLPASLELHYFPGTQFTRTSAAHGIVGVLARVQRGRGWGYWPIGRERERESAPRYDKAFIVHDPP